MIGKSWLGGLCALFWLPPLSTPSFAGSEDAYYFCQGEAMLRLRQMHNIVESTVFVAPGDQPDAVDAAWQKHFVEKFRQPNTAGHCEHFTSEAQARKAHDATKPTAATGLVSEEWSYKPAPPAAPVPDAEFAGVWEAQTINSQPVTDPAARFLIKVTPKAGGGYAFDVIDGHDKYPSGIRPFATSISNERAEGNGFSFRRTFTAPGGSLFSDYSGTVAGDTMTAMYSIPTSGFLVPFTAIRQR